MQARRVFAAALLSAAATALVAILNHPAGWPVVSGGAFASTLAAYLWLRQLRSKARAFAIARELEEQRQAAEQRELQRDRDRLQSILGAMSEGVVLIDQDQRIQLANPSARLLLNLHSSLELDGPFPGDFRLTGNDAEGPPTLLDVNRLPLLLALAERGLSGERAAEELTLQNGRQVLVRTAPLSSTESDSTVLVFNDVTDLRRLEAVRRDLVANVSHELRTPLTAIRGYAETLQDGGLRDPERAMEFIGIIHRHAERLSRLLDDLLELSRLEAGSRPLKREPLTLGPVILRSLDLVRPKAATRQVELSVDFPEGPELLGDGEALEQVLVNLLDNAVKYTPKAGRVALQARTEGSGRSARWHIAVSDNGIGIQTAHLPRVFERFYRVDSGRSREMGGTGLGLAIVKHLAQAMGGRVGVESEAGKGSTFWIEMPLSEEPVVAEA